MTPDEQIDLATELWAIAQAPTGEIGIEGVTQLMIPVIAAYTAAVEAKERERCASLCENMDVGMHPEMDDIAEEIIHIECAIAIRGMK